MDDAMDGVFFASGSDSATRSIVRRLTKSPRNDGPLDDVFCVWVDEGCAPASIYGEDLNRVQNVHGVTYTMEPTAPERIAQIDMDGTLVDYDRALESELIKLASPGEVQDDNAPWVKARKRLIKSQPGFWENLPRLEAGFEVLALIKEIGFEVKVLTKGPENLLNAWTEKVRWCRKHLGVGVPVTVCEGKGDTYGRVLFDDWPPYITDWMKWRPRGLVVMMGHYWNLGFTHPNVIRIDRDHLARDLKDLRPRLQAAYDR